jgi:Spherulation-specific family 4
MSHRERIRSRSRIRKRVVVVVLIASLSTLGFLGALIIPLYSYPGIDWNSIVQSKLANPEVPMVVIINPDNGPGLSQDPNYVKGVNSLRSAGVLVLGYDHTSYAARSLPDVIGDINSYKSWYNVSGIFFDEMSNVPGKEAYYSSLSDYAKSIGLSFTVGNPGSGVPSSYLGTMDVIVVDENQGVPNSTSLASMTSGMPKNNFAVIAYGVNVWNGSSASNIFNYASYVYISNNTLPNPYGALSGDFSKLVALLASPTQTSVPLSVGSADTRGTPILGLWTSIKSTNGSVVFSGYTPLTHSVHSSADYVVSISDSGSFVFDHWSDLSTNPNVTLTVTQGTILTAYFKTAQTNTSMSTTTGTLSTSTSTNRNSSTVASDTTSTTGSSVSLATTGASVTTTGTSYNSGTVTTSNTAASSSTTNGPGASPSIVQTYLVLAAVISALAVTMTLVVLNTRKGL